VRRSGLTRGGVTRSPGPSPSRALTPRNHSL
jgi:hypothetical protein